MNPMILQFIITQQNGTDRVIIRKKIHVGVRVNGLVSLNLDKTLLVITVVKFNPNTDTLNPMYSVYDPQFLSKRSYWVGKVHDS